MKRYLPMFVLGVAACGAPSVPGASSDPQTAELPAPIQAPTPELTGACCTMTGCQEASAAACDSLGGWPQAEMSCAMIDCKARVATGVSLGDAPLEGGEEEGACCVASESACGFAALEDCVEVGGMFAPEQSCGEACPEFQVVEEEEDGVCCLAASNACFLTDLGYCTEALGGSIGESCEAACPELEDQTTQEFACCFENADCEDLAPALCAVDGGTSQAGATCDASMCGR